MTERIKRLIEKHKMTATQFAAEIGVQRSAVSHILSGRNKPSLDFILKIKNRFPEIRLDWILMGEGKMLESKTGEGEIIDPTKKEPDEIINEVPTVKKDSISESEDNSSRTIHDPEEAIRYQTNFLSGGKKVEKVILVFADNTFQILDSQ